MASVSNQWTSDLDYASTEPAFPQLRNAAGYNGQPEILVFPALQHSHLPGPHFKAENTASIQPFSPRDSALGDIISPRPISESFELVNSIDSSMPLVSRRSSSTPHWNDGTYQTSENESPNVANLGLPARSEREDEFGVCLGVINAMSSSSFSGTHPTPITISPYGKVLKLAFLDSGKYAGILNSPALCSLLQSFKLQFSAQLLPPEGNRGPMCKNDSKQQRQSPKLCPTRIVIYAMEGNESEIGIKLSRDGLFLQHPYAHECSSQHVRYSNPHYLARPGSEPPTLEDLTLTSDGSCSSQPCKLDEASMSRLLRVFDLAEPDESGVSMSVQPSSRLSANLMSHQGVALATMIARECGIVNDPRFPTLWASVEGNRWRHKITGKTCDKPVPVSGGVLADEMGLGKTLSVLALICSSIDDLASHQTVSQHDNPIGTGTLIIAPKSTITAWQDQIDRHIHKGQVKTGIYHGTKRRQVASQLQQFDAVITTYETLRSDWEASGPLFQQKWLRVVLDEAHHIRNRSSLAFKSATALTAKYRWCLTGTPIHNSLDDFGALLAFIGVELFHDKPAFDSWIATSLQKTPRLGLNRLKDLVRATCLRRTKASRTVNLGLREPTKNIESVHLHDEDRALYEFFHKKISEIATGNNRAVGQTDRGNSGNPKVSEDNNILFHMNVLRLICNHGRALLPAKALSSWHHGDSSETEYWQNGAAFLAKECGLCGADLGDPGEDDESDPRSASPGKSDRGSLCETCYIMNPGMENSTRHSAMAPSQGKRELVDAPAPTRPSAKVEALLKNLLKEREKVGSEVSPVKKSVIFSSWTRMLTLIEPVLKQHHIPFQRIDGQKSLDARREALREFNSKSEFTVLLASIGSCGEGIDLTAASNVHILEPHWSPMAEAQAIDRVHRKGQKGHVTVTRYIVPKSIETYVQWIQESKLRLISQSMNAIDEAEEVDIIGERTKMLQKFLRGEINDLLP
ncbi:SNF2 family N-terminal domain-containing protein [Podospora conica]|nr:SNF2 family N-terminal domain-containing protein [Schizothecium conicum]